MKASTILLSYVVIQALAHPSMDRVMNEIQSRQDFIVAERSTTLLGDLQTGVVTANGQTIKNILQQVQGATANSNSPAYTPPGPLGSSACKADQLCVWSHLATEMWRTFADPSGCTNLARGAIRQGFHDAASWDTSSAHGGADGSLLLSDELSRPDNRGLEAIGAVTKAYYAKYHPHGAGMADIIQLGAKVGTIACPGGPRIRAFTGRKDDARAAPLGKLPNPFMDARTLIDLFAAKTFTATDLVALLGSHTAARQRFVDPARAGAALDASPGTWDASFYRQVLTGDNRTVFVLPSDRALAVYPLTTGQWNLFAGSVGQRLWNPAYAQAYFRMSLLGVNNINQLKEITRVLPSR